MIKGFLQIIRKDNPLKQAQDLAYQMIGMCARMCRESMYRLRDPGKCNPDFDIQAEDKAVNKLEREVRRKIVSYLAVGYERDLNTGLILTSTIIDMERLGDYTKNMTELSQNYQNILRAGDYENDLQRVESIVLSSFDAIVHILQNSDMDGSRHLIDECKIALDLCDRAVDQMILGKTNGFTAAQAVVVALYFRYLKRVAAHLKNIATSVVNPFTRLGFKEKKKKD